MIFDNEVSNQLKSEFDNDKSKNKVALVTYIIIFLILLIPLSVYLIKRKPYSLVNSFDNLPSPVQLPISGSAEMITLGKKLKIDFFESCDINGKVISINNYNSVSDISDKISPKSFVLGWGLLGVQENIDKFNRNVGDLAFIELKPGNELWYDEVGGKKVVSSNYSVNRLIPSDRKTGLALKKIKEGDNIRIKGYLSQVIMNAGNQIWGPSCAKSSDYGCNVIYVTDVTWLREM